VWAVLEGTFSEEIFEGSSEEEASNWINTSGQAWLEERRRKRKARPPQMYFLIALCGRFTNRLTWRALHTQTSKFLQNKSLWA
jgi:hypothetical protein